MKSIRKICCTFIGMTLLLGTFQSKVTGNTEVTPEPMLTNLSLLTGFPSDEAKESNTVLIQMGGVITLDSEFSQKEPDLNEYLKQYPLQLNELSTDLKKALRLERISLQNQGTEVLEMTKPQKLDYFEPGSGLELWMTLVSFTADQVVYHVKCTHASVNLVDTDISVLNGKRAVVGGMNGDSAPYFFIVIEPLNYLLKGRPLDSVLQNPKLIHRVNPDYPETCLKAHISGSVLVEARITKNGKPVDIKAMESPHPDLSAAAIAALEQWEFRAATLNDQPVEVYSSFTIIFRLEEQKEPAAQ
jgi:TonB family protein